MTTRYHVEYDGPRIRIIEATDGEWPRFNMARAAAIEHLERQVRECSMT